MDEETRYKAAAAVVALANRAESAGVKQAKSAKGAQWQPMPFEPSMVINPAKLREAADYYLIAESIDAAAAGWGYPRALVLEQMGAFDEAITAFKSLKKTPYAGPGELGANRCKQKKAGKFDPEVVEDEDEAVDEAALDAAIDAKLAKLDQYLKDNPDAGKRKPVDNEDKVRDEASATALAFVNHLLDRDYKAARAMLHPWDSGLTEEEIRDEFEPMFETEEFPEAANVFDVQLDMPDMEDFDLAWVYVNIDSKNAEAVTLTVARHKKKLVVRNLEWGRP